MEAIAQSEESTPAVPSVFLKRSPSSPRFYGTPGQGQVQISSPAGGVDSVANLQVTVEQTFTSCGPDRLLRSYYSRHDLSALNCFLL